MRFTRVAIRNFRSIKDVEFTLDPRCRTLVGINESGKSNILAALSYLLPDKKPSKGDVRYERGSEQIVDAWVRFIFSLEDADHELILRGAMKSVYSDRPDAVILNVADKSSPMTLSQFCKSRREGMYSVDFIKETKASKYWTSAGNLIVDGQWKVPTAKCPPEFEATTKDGRKVKIAEFKLVDLDGLTDVPTDHVADASIATIDRIVGEQIIKAVTAALPGCQYWTYGEGSLLPGQVNMTAFAADPNSCVPLKNMFELAGISDIAKELNDKKTQSPHVLRNMLHKVAQMTTEHIRSVWKDYQTIRIDLSPNADNIDATVSERNAKEGEISTQFDFGRRSDGFKRFVTFLLLVSAKVKSKSLTNTLLLIDEPEVGLHPSGAKHLMNELIEIAKQNHVVFCTHSISMIDKDAVGRHIIVEKKDEITTIRQADKSNIVDEEVIFNAIGFSIFENLRPKNIVFEGWRDKRLCQLAVKERLKDDAAIQSLFENDVGMCHAEGVRDIRNITELLQMANRRCLVISDDDLPAKEQQRNYVKNRGHGVWKRYSELRPGTNVTTGEDFIKITAFRPAIDRIRALHPNLPPLLDADLSGPGGRLDGFERWLTTGGISVDDRRALVRGVKEQVFDDLKAPDIEDVYLEIVRAMTSAEYWPS